MKNYGLNIGTKKINEWFLDTTKERIIKYVNASGVASQAVAAVGSASATCAEGTITYDSDYQSFSAPDGVNDLSFDFDNILLPLDQLAIPVDGETIAHRVDGAIYINPSKSQAWDLKQDYIYDLATIRSGAALGATALQEHQDISGKQDALTAGDGIKIESNVISVTAEGLSTGARTITAYNAGGRA